MLFLFCILFYLCPLSNLGVTLHNCTQRKTCRELFATFIRSLVFNDAKEKQSKSFSVVVVVVVFVGNC